jgi:nitrate/nitrite transporter NarK
MIKGAFSLMKHKNYFEVHQRGTKMTDEFVFYVPSVITSFSTCIDIGGDNAGTVAGIMNCFGQLGVFFMAIVFGKIVDITHSFTTPLFILCGVLFTGGLLWLFIDAGKVLVEESTNRSNIAKQTYLQ